jgi:hypothetical protein
MMMRRLDNKQLDELGKALVKTDGLSSAELDRIAGDPALLVGVLKRIELEVGKPRARRSIFRSRRVTVGAFVVMFGIVGLSFVALKNDPALIAQRHVPAPVPPTLKTSDIKQFDEPDQVIDTKLPPVETAIRSQRISDRPIAVRPNRQQEPVAQQARYENEFYALSFAGDPNETERGGRIVRVDIPKSTLFAMGVDIPLENETETVKADLLVGNDGVTRAIRVVK